MSNVLDLILPYSMWRRKGRTGEGQWKVTARFQMDTCSGFIEGVRITHFAKHGPSDRSRYLTAQKFLAEFVYLPPPEPYRRSIPGVKMPEIDISEANDELTKAYRKAFPEMAAEGERNRYVADLEERVKELEADRMRLNAITRMLA